LATFRRQRSPIKKGKESLQLRTLPAPDTTSPPPATTSSGALVQSIEKAVGHAFPRHYLDKAWRVEGLDGVYLAEDGSLRCVVRWERSVVAASDLRWRGAAQTKRGIIQGAEWWEKWQKGPKTWQDAGGGGKE